MACAFSQVKVEKYAHGQRGSPKTGPLLACEDRNGDMAHSARDLRRDCYAAVDIGASSGRVVVGFVEDGRIHLEEVHRFDNR